MLSKSNYAAIIPVKNVARAVNFYTRKLGGSVTMKGTGDMKDMWASVRVGKVEFWLSKTDNKEKGRKLAYNIFVVKNIKATVNGMKKKSVKLWPAEKMMGEKIDGPIAYSPWGASAFFDDSEGNLLMLFQAPKM